MLGLGSNVFPRKEVTFYTSKFIFINHELFYAQLVGLDQKIEIKVAAGNSKTSTQWPEVKTKVSEIAAAIQNKPEKSSAATAKRPNNYSGSITNYFSTINEISSESTLELTTKDSQRNNSMNWHQDFDENEFLNSVYVDTIERVTEEQGHLDTSEIIHTTTTEIVKTTSTQKQSAYQDISDFVGNNRNKHGSQSMLDQFRAPIKKQLFHDNSREPHLMYSKQNQPSPSNSLSNQKDFHIDIKRPSYDESVYDQGTKKQSHSHIFQNKQNSIPQSCTVVSDDTIHSTQEPIVKNTCNSNEKIAGFTSAKILFDEGIKSIRASSKNSVHLQKPYEISHKKGLAGIDAQMRHRLRQFNANCENSSKANAESLSEHRNSDTIRFQSITKGIPKNFSIG